MELEIIAVREVVVKYKTVKKFPQTRKIANSRDIYNLYRDRILSERVELFQVLLLNTKNEILAIETISRGDLSGSLVHPREVFSTPVRLQAAAVVFLHNHPSGDSTPSQQDKDCTARLYSAGQILGIKVLDHIIFGFTDYFSFSDAGLLGAGR